MNQIEQFIGSPTNIMIIGLLGLVGFLAALRTFSIQPNRATAVRAFMSYILWLAVPLFTVLCIWFLKALKP
jgi:hypothetical protein